MTDTPDPDLKTRIKELGDKSTQLLVFLSFGLVVAVTASTNDSLNDAQQAALHATALWWAIAAIPVLIGILPLKEICWENSGWYQFVRGLKVGLLWIAIGLIGWGLRQFIPAI